MTELKTLKDMNFVRCCEKGEGCARELKAEAIKWVKDCPSCDLPRYICSEDSKMIRFFNLTEEDLK